MGKLIGKQSRKLESELEKTAENQAKLGESLIFPKTTVNFGVIAYAFNKGYRYVALEGSSRSGKTWATMQWCIYASLRPDLFVKQYMDGEIVPFQGKSIKIRCLRFDAVNARDSIWADLCKIMEQAGFSSGSNGFEKNETKMHWKFPNGSMIICGGANDPGKLHGLEQDITFLNEVMMIPKSALDQLEYRTRVGFIFDWNPSLNDHWVFKGGFDKTHDYGKDERLAGKPKCLYFHSTYKDNIENLNEAQISGIEQYEPTPGNIERGTADAYMWSVYGMGKRGFIEGRVIPPEKVEIVSDDQFPTASQWELHGYGLDWGFSQDPTALIECAIFNKKLYVRELIYEKNLIVAPDPTLPTARSVIGLMRELHLKPTDTIVADSARPDLNAALRNAGFLVMDAYKPGGSIENGVNLMNQRKWCVTDSSFNVKFELENWTWAKTRYGEQTRKPIDKHNHGQDAIRYWLTSFVGSDNVARMGSSDGDSVAFKQSYSCNVDDWGF